MTTLPPEVRFLTRGWERGTGAMFRKSLDGEIIVFVYQRPAAHLFHTFFSPPLRMLALDDAGMPLSDDVVSPNRFQRLPASRLVVECEPSTALTIEDLSEIAACAPALSSPPGPLGKGARPWTG